jgi:amidohydrolase
MLKNTIKELAEEVKPNVIENRRHLHANPELSFHEYNTSAFIKTFLDQQDIPWKPMAGTGVVGIIQGNKPSDKIIALRADMDALPITEANDIPYVSTNKGVMHACGHDAHTSSLLGTASILQSIKDKFGGTIKLIFQPAEEKLPGGASIMIKEGVLTNPTPQAILAQHVLPSLEVGKISLRGGLHMASMDEIVMTVRGKGGHGAQPHLTIDPVLISSHIIVALQQLVSRMANPSLPTVLSIGKVIANGRINIIPDEVYMEGTLRTFDEKWRNEAHAQIKKLATGLAASMGAHCDIIIERGYPFLTNKEELAAQVKQFASEYIGKENVVEAEQWMAAEDFAYYSQKMDACFYLLGTGNREKNITSGLHTPTFNIDETALGISTGLMAYIAVKQLES